MEKLVLMVTLITLVDFSIALSYNQPKFSPCASWDPNGISYGTTIVNGAYPDGIFVDINNIVFFTSLASNSVQAWLAGSLTPIGTISGNLDKPIGLFVSIIGDVYIDNGKSHNRVDKWKLNATSGEIVMNVSTSCYGLFIDINDTLYCSMPDINQVVKKSLDSNGTLASIAAGNGSSGNGPYDLNKPQGIFVDEKLRLYVADRINDRIQRFDFEQLNGTTIVGNGTTETISLNEPTAVILDADDYLFIVDSNNHRIVGSGPTGYRCLVGCSTSVGTQMTSAQTLSFDSYGNIFVTDTNNNYVHKFLLSTNYCNFTQSTQNIHTAAVVTTLFMEETASIKPSSSLTMTTTHQTTRASTHSTQMETTMISENTKPMETYSTTHSVKIPLRLPNFIPPACNDSYRTGVSCNISNAPCDVFKPCQNAGTCINNKSIPNGYVCQCPAGFNGGDCQLDMRPCKTNTCWNNGTCLNKSNSDFLCICAEGWIGLHCETQVNYCQNITCKNGGVCRPLFQDYKCECSTSSYSGRSCEFTASTLVARKFASKSLGYIAIICILIVIGFFVALDALKYIFRIDPTRDERQRLQREKISKKNPVIATRFKYVNAASSPIPPTSSDTSITIIEETHV